jgi:hypothetical protein
MYLKSGVPIKTGYGNSREISLAITILPHGYRSWWAFTFYICAALALAWLYISYKNRQARLQYEIRLAHLETDKERELNEKKLSFFTNDFS